MHVALVAISPAPIVCVLARSRGCGAGVGGAIQCVKLAVVAVFGLRRRGWGVGAGEGLVLTYSLVETRTGVRVLDGVGDLRGVCHSMMGRGA